MTVINSTQSAGGEAMRRAISTKIPAPALPAQRSGERAPTRRQLLKGAAGAGAVALIVPSLPWEQAFADSVDHGDWTFWLLRADGSSCALDAVTSSGATYATVAGIPPTVRRTPDGKHILTVELANTPAGACRRVSLRSSVDGSRLAVTDGAAFDDSNVIGHEFDLAVSADGTLAAIADVAWLVTETGTASVPDNGMGAAKLVPAVQASSVTTLELFALTPSLSTVGVTTISPNGAGDAWGATAGFAGDQPLVLFETKKGAFASIAQASGKYLKLATSPVVACPAAGSATLSHDSGAFLVTTGLTSLMILDASGRATALDVFPAEASAAGPYPTQILRATAGSVVVVNPGISAAAILDTTSRQVVASAGLPPTRARSSGALDSQTVAITSDYMFATDPASRTGGIWVYSLPDLKLVDRWLSSTGFSCLQASPDGSTVCAIQRDANVALLLSRTGAVTSVLEMPGPPIGLL